MLVTTGAPTGSAEHDHQTARGRELGPDARRQVALILGLLEIRLRTVLIVVLDLVPTARRGEGDVVRLDARRTREQRNARIILIAVVLPKRRGRVKSAARVFVSIRSLIMSVLSTQYALREKAAQSLVPTGGGSRSMPSLPRIMGTLYQKLARGVRHECR